MDTAELWILLGGIVVCIIWLGSGAASWNADDEVDPTVDPFAALGFAPLSFLVLSAVVRFVLLPVLSAHGIDFDYYEAIKHLLGQH